ncbi:hypothetical protein [Mycobacterium asiaticum]|uniref:Uncharacterized protein n=1 Tax=Mycobacterium asiaticum TaxID=1790 RepID=A0A1A3NQE3_MYCAS|nr:hypothetical protein [Mycobacterium asiaticum]OBK22522.1 hypothetical protein A5635_21640 [Mycobacterium asiaticum]
MSVEDIAEDTRQYVIECSNALSELTDLVGQLLAVERARAAAEGIAVDHQLSCEDCGFPISSNRDVCGDCEITRAVKARAS